MVSAGPTGPLDLEVKMEQQLRTASEDAPSEVKPCLCGAYEIEIWDGREIPEGADPGDYVRYEDTGCRASTTRDFAPGHDAKLKALLIRAGVAGHEVRLNSGGVASTGSASDHASRYPFAYMVDNGIKRGREKAATRRNGPAAKRAAKKAELKITRMRIKVGRWEYDATIDGKTETAIYLNNKGTSVGKNKGQYTIVGPVADAA
jgi:hypothetical protein